METLTFGQLYGRWLDNVAQFKAGGTGAGHAAIVQALLMAQEAGLVTVNGGKIEPTFADATDFKVELTDRGPVIVVPEGRFPQLAHYAAVDGMGGEMLRYE